MGVRPLLGMALLTLAACGVRGQQTPEPHETERINHLVEQLGTQRTYNRQTLIMNPEPDGRILLRWIDRRKATLDGTLVRYQLPAPNNPGTIGAALAWERAAEQAEGQADRERRDRCGEHPCPIEPPADPQWTPLEGEGGNTATE